MNEKVSFQIIALFIAVWAVGAPPTAECPGWCHQPATILNAPNEAGYYKNCCTFCNTDFPAKGNVLHILKIIFTSR